MMYTGSDSVYSFTFEYGKRADCPVCGGESIEVDAQADWTLETFLEKLEARQDVCVIAKAVVELQLTFQSD